MVIPIHTTDFQNLITTPTRITAYFASVLDLNITNNKGAFHAGRIATVISDHLPVLFVQENTNSLKSSL